MTATTTPANIIAGADTGHMWLIQNLGDDIVWVARSEAGCTVAGDNAVVLPAGAEIRFEVGMQTFTGGTGIWVRADSATADVRALQIG